MNLFQTPFRASIALAAIILLLWIAGESFPALNILLSAGGNSRFPASGLFTFWLVHFDWGHLAANMIALVILGWIWQQNCTAKRFLTIFFISSVGSGITYMFLLILQPSGVLPMLGGASGGITGLAAAGACRQFSWTRRGACALLALGSLGVSWGNPCMTAVHSGGALTALAFMLWHKLPRFSAAGSDK